MCTRSRKGGIVGLLLGGLLFAVVAVAIFGIVIANTIKVQHRETSKGETVRIQTPLGEMNIDARDGLNPETIGVPVYPGAQRVKDHRGGVTFDFSGEDGIRKNFSVVAASYSTNDSVEKVREFYSTHLPNWTVSQRHGNDLQFRLSEGGYKRIIGINERWGQTHIGIASFGEPGVN
jgi:hypothetical protein